MAIIFAIPIQTYGESITLASGQKVELEDVVKTYLRDGKNWVLVFNYVTDVPIDDEESTKRQAALLFDYTIEGIEKAKATATAFRAFNGPKAIIGVTFRKSYTTVFEKNDGKWEMYDPN
ncbi:MAG TPA: hypothetical protein VIR60_00780 [Gammaproteobacteria bacterium]